MITAIEIDGFKTFQNFRLDLAPLQVIVGANGVGKSNLFDALRLLAHLADDDLRAAFQNLRGEANELFTILPNGQAADTVHFAVEMLVERQIRDSWGAQADLKHTRLRYELVIQRRTDELGLERLYVMREILIPIRRDDDIWIRDHIGKTRDRWLPSLKAGRKDAFISTEIESDVATIYLHQDGHGGRRPSVAEKVERTVLSGVTNTEFPHVLAAREEIRSWKFLQLNPDVLRQPSSMVAHQSISPDGSNLPSTLARMQAEEPYLLADVSRDLANLVPGVMEIAVEADQPRNRYVIKALTQDGHWFSSRVLSDGTLRLLTLVTLKNDPNHRGVLCFEEPENGVHPFRLQSMVQLLRGLTTDFSDPEQAGEPLRQLLVNTHSPVLVIQFVAESGDRPGTVPGLIFAHMAARVHPGEQLLPVRVTLMEPVNASRQTKLNVVIDRAEQAYTLGQVLAYLESADANGAIATLTGVGVT